ncbi:MAG: acyl-CoA carboxylase subunit epsilon [Egibacteraceae bacterium]
MSLRPGTWVRVVRGAPTPEQLAALVLTLDQAMASGDDAPPARKPPAWQRAARLEGLGAAPLVSATDPRLHGHS